MKKIFCDQDAQKLMSLVVSAVDMMERWTARYYRSLGESLSTLEAGAVAMKARITELNERCVGTHRKNSLRRGLALANEELVVIERARIACREGLAASSTVDLLTDQPARKQLRRKELAAQTLCRQAADLHLSLIEAAAEGIR